MTRKNSHVSFNLKSPEKNAKFKDRLAPIFADFDQLDVDDNKFVGFEEDCEFEDSLNNKNLAATANHFNLTDLLKHFSKTNTVCDDPSHPETERNLMSQSSLAEIYNRQNIKMLETYGNYLILYPELPINKVRKKKSKCPGFFIYKSVFVWRHYFNLICVKITVNPIFESLSLLLIVFNSISLALESPDNQNTQSKEINNENESSTTFSMENIFLLFYTLEMVLKIGAKGFVLNKNSYLRDSWNILDFVIVFSGYLALIFSESAGNLSQLSSLRSLRVLRPLKTISSIKNLKNIILTIISSLPFLVDVTIVILFFFIIMAIAGLQLFSEILKSRCFDPHLGYVMEIDIICGDNLKCLDNHICASGYENPSNGVINFDNIITSFLMVFQSVTLEGWSTIMKYLTNAIGYVVVVYFILIVMIGAYFLLNLTLAVIVVKFNENKSGSKIKGHHKKDIDEASTFEEKARKLLDNQLQQYELGVNLHLLKNAYPLISKHLSKLKEPQLDQKLQKCITQGGKVVFKKVKLYNEYPLRQQSTTSKISFDNVKEEKEEVSDMNINNNKNLPVKPLSNKNLTASNRKYKSVFDSKEAFDDFDQNNEEINLSDLNFVNLRGETPTNEISNFRKDSYRNDNTPSESASRDLSSSDDSEENHSISEEKNSGLEPIKINQKQEIRASFQNFLLKDFISHNAFHVINLFQPSNLEKKIHFPPDVEVPSQNKVDVIEESPINKIQLNNYNELDNSSSSLLRSPTKTIDGSPTKPLSKFRLRKKSLIQAKKNSLKKKSVQNEEIKKNEKKIRAYNKGIEKILYRICKKNFRIEVDYCKTHCNLPQYDSSDDVMPLKILGEKQANAKEFQKVLNTRKLQILYSNAIRLNSNKNYQNEKNFSLSSKKIQKHVIKDFFFGNKANSSTMPSEIKSDVSEALTQKSDFPGQTPSKTNFQTYSMTFDEVKEFFNKDCLLSNNPNKEFPKNYFEINELYKFMREQDIKFGKIKKMNYSGDNVLIETIYTKKTNRILESLNDQNSEMWEGSIYGVFQAMRRKIKAFIDNKFIENIIMILVFVNTIILASDGLLSVETDNALNTLNTVFTFIFAFEMIFKLIGYGPKAYTRDFFNIFDAGIVLLSITELAIKMQSGNSSGNALSAFRAARLFRTFRVLRVTRLLRSLRFMKIIIEVVGASLTDFFYIALLLFLFIFIFTLLGMQIFGGYFQNEDGTLSTVNFDSFYKAFLAIFQLLTLENWDSILNSIMISKVNHVIGVLFLIVWIIIGNYLFLNLFLAILLDGFTSNDISNKVHEILNDDKELKELEKQIYKQPCDEVMITEQKTTENNIDTFNIENKLSEFEMPTPVQKKKKNPMQDVVCNFSFFLFSKENLFRIFIAKIISHRHFEKIIIALIVLGSLKLVMETYITEGSEFEAQVAIPFLALDYFFTVSFFLEALFKMIKYGVAFCPNSYLRDSWSCLDFIIVITSILDLSLSEANLKYFKVLRLLRTLRPLRFISHNQNMKLVVNALFESFNAILNVVVVILFVWLMFGILGVNMMQGKLNYCDVENPYNVTKIMCDEMQKNWITFGFNFENIFEGMKTLFVISTLEDWPYLMYKMMDASSDGPILDNSKYFGLFYVVFILFSSFFLMNLFIGVIFMNYEKEQAKEKNKKYALLDDDQIKWIQMQQLIVKAKPKFSLTSEPKLKIQKYLAKFLKSKLFDAFIITCIVLNIIIMGMTYVGAVDVYIVLLDDVNYFFTSVFILEAIMKVIGFGIKGYFYDPWNQFDFVIVLSSIVDIIMNIIGQSFSKILRVAPQIARVLRVLRISRLFKLMKSKSLEGITKIINVMIYAFPSMLNIISLIFILFFIYSVLGVFLFKGTDFTQSFGRDTLISFDNFGKAFLTLFICSTGEDWPLVMNALQNSVSDGSKLVPIIFFISFVAQCTFVLMNMFVLIVIQQFEQLYLNPDNPLDTFSEIVSSFRNHWNKFTSKHRGKKIDSTNLVEFFSTLDYPYGFRHPSDNDNPDSNETIIPRLEIAKAVLSMRLPIDSQGCALFGPVFHSVLKKAFGTECLQNASEEVLLVIKKKEVKALNKILAKSKKFKKHKEKKNLFDFKTANPLITILLTKMTVNSWARYTRENYEKIMMKRRMSSFPQTAKEINEYINFSNDDKNKEDDLAGDFKEAMDELELKNQRNNLNVLASPIKFNSKHQQ